MGRAIRLARMKVERNLRWGRTHGWANLIEEHDVDPRVRIPRAARRARWLLRDRVPAGSARAVFLVGAQRSGTNMIAHGLDQAPEFSVYNEGNGRAFRNYQLREQVVIDDLVARSRRPFVLFKPLCDTDRTARLLDETRSESPPRAVWAFRDVDGRIRSHVLKFGASNVDAFRAFVDGSDTTSWQVRSLSEESAELVRSLDVARMSSETGSALFWYVRNKMYFELGLDKRTDVVLADYRAFLSDPTEAMGRLCAFIGFPYRPELVAHVQPQPQTLRKPVDIDPRVRSLCDELDEQLLAAYASELPRHKGPTA